MMRFFASVVLTIALVGCASQQVRDNVLFPTAISAYAGIEADIAAAATPEQLIKAEIFRHALESRDTAQLMAAAYLWYDLRQLAELGIDAQVLNGTISPGVADSFEERLRNFELTLAAIGVLQAAETQ